MRLASILLLLAACPLAAAEPAWPQFRGPGGAGVADAAKVPVEVGPTKNVLWKVAAPPGFSSPVVAGGKLFLTGFEGGKLFTLAYDAGTGKELWRREAPAKAIEAYHKTEGSPAASTVATDGTRVVGYFGSCGLFAYDPAGELLWKYELPTVKTDSDFGTGTSPVLAGGLVVLGRDQAKAGGPSRILALDAKSGSLAWETPRSGAITSFATPAVWETPGGTQVVFPGAKKLTAYDLKSGKEVWTVTGMPSVTCTTPVVVGTDLVFAGWSPGGATEMKMPTFDDILKADADGDGAISRAESENTFLKGFFDSNDTNKDGKISRDEWDAAMGAMAGGKNCAVAITPGGKGDITATHVRWRVTKGMPYVPSPLVYRDQMYVINMRGQLSAYDVKTGKDVFLEEGVGLTGVYASPVAANGHVYLFGLDGSVVVLKPGDFADVKHRAKFGERIAATPAIAGDTLYVRTASSLYAFKAK